MDTEAKIILDDTISFCERDGRDARLIQILKQSEALELTDTDLSVEVPTRFAYSYLVKQRDVVERYLEDIAFTPLALNITVSQAITAPQEHTAAAGATTGSAPEERPRIPTVDWDAPAPESRDRVKVKNIISPDALRELTASVQQHEPATTVEPKARQESAAAGPSVPINSKFTFENFVYGDENKHAYQSSVRFALMADEPGIYTSLFIYGKSGLGKTHLLLAIENYLSEHNPGIRVKYANSQTYVEDYINELRVQKTNGGRILREYHDADVLIIDDIQNIIGRQASIEFFFQLVDEFIRENKKIVIASDRAPKKLGMDERLTSRFNSGMLCLVSEPGFEMKYAILRNYYEHTIRGSQNVAIPGAGASLLDGIGLEEGHLSDDQLRHMAEISGNNIRELESFCERCAGLSYEREQAGSELTAADIDAIADEYFDTAHKVIRVDTVQSVVEEFYHVSHEDMIGRKRSKNIAFPRHVAVYLTNTLCEMSLKAVGSAFGRDHTTVIHSLEVVETKMKEDARFNEEVQQLKNIILIKS